jgi:hypothetical protein
VREVGYRVLSYEEAKELLERGKYRYLVGWYAFEASAKYYCRQLDSSELECVKVWYNGRTGGKGGTVFRGTPEEVCAWIKWDTKGGIGVDDVIFALWGCFNAVVDPKKVDSAQRSVVKKVLGVTY